MTNNKMLIDGTHPEETRVVVVRGNRVEEFDFESESRKQLRGNIYLAKVTRVEPSLQAAFVDYGGNRHGFLAFSEIHPDYYQIPVADRQALIEEEARAAVERAQLEESAEGTRAPRGRRRNWSRRGRGQAPAESPMSEPGAEQPSLLDGEAGAVLDEDGDPTAARSLPAEVEHDRDEVQAEPAPVEDETSDLSSAMERDDASEGEEQGGDNASATRERAEDSSVEALGGAGDAMEDSDRPRRFAPRRYKIQEVIKRRQIILVQVVKEERGNKGAALTTYLSLAGRYSVLMPNTARGGGISRKIANSEDRKHLKDIVGELDVPEGMGVIVRTAGAARTKPEIKRDFEYLMRLWENVADLTLKSQAPALVYEEGSLIKRSIRDLFGKDVSDIHVAGEQAVTEAQDFMKMLMPSHSKHVIPYHESTPIFTKFGVESELDKMLQPQVQLKSGGYVVINQTEALVAIDVNSGRATREHNIEDTALRTNLEAAEEIARQLRLRDLAGLIVIDFIDMEEGRNKRVVERKMKDCLRHDRARIQVGHISHFGLLEMSRQRLRSSVLESTTERCPHCDGTGHVRSPSSSALHVLRLLEDRLLADSASNLVLRVRTHTALYILNTKRAHITELEQRFGVRITIDADDKLPTGAPCQIERADAARFSGVRKHAGVQVDSVNVADIPMDEEPDVADSRTDPSVNDTDGEGAERNADGSRRRRRRGRRGGVRRSGYGVGRDDSLNAESAAFDEDEGAAPVADPETPAAPARGRAPRRGPQPYQTRDDADQAVPEKRTPRRRTRQKKHEGDEVETDAPQPPKRMESTPLKAVSQESQESSDEPPAMPRIPDLPPVEPLQSKTERKGWWSRKILG